MSTKREIVRTQDVRKTYVMGDEIVSRWCPMTWEAFKDYRLGGLQLSRLEAEVLSALSRGSPEEALRLARESGWLEEGPEGLKRNREREELQEKLKILRIFPPWGKSEVPDDS